MIHNTKSTYNKATIYSATNTLKRFFDNMPDQNKLTKSQMLSAAGRDALEFEQKNTWWLSGKLTALYSHSLVKPVYSYNPWKQLLYIELTPKGKLALGRDDAPEVLYSQTATDSSQKNPTQIQELTIDEIISALPHINEKLAPTGMGLKFVEVKSK